MDHDLARSHASANRLYQPVTAQSVIDLKHVTVARSCPKSQRLKSAPQSPEEAPVKRVAPQTAVHKDGHEDCSIGTVIDDHRAAKQKRGLPLKIRCKQGDIRRSETQAKRKRAKRAKLSSKVKGAAKSASTNEEIPTTAICDGNNTEEEERLIDLSLVAVVTRTSPYASTIPFVALTSFDVDSEIDELESTEASPAPAAPLFPGAVVVAIDDDADSPAATTYPAPSTSSSEL
ncbi:unnamed protein product [Parajaminaea phylloscopi]